MMFMITVCINVYYFINTAFRKMDTKVIEIDQNHVVEVAIKRKIGMHEKKGQKRTSPTANSIPGQKVEKKRSITSNDKNWCVTFAKQNASYLKQDQVHKHCTMKDAKNQQKNCDKHMNANSSKRISSQKKSEDHSKTLCCSSCSPSVLVQDRAIQHPEICDKDKSAEFNPIHTLYSLMKELKDLVRNNKKACEISNKIEQELSKISANPENLLSEDFKIKLKDSKAQMEDSSEKIKNTWGSLLSEREKLQSQIQKQENYIKEIDHQHTNLEIHAKKLKEQLEEVTRAAEAKDKMISILKRQIENSELSERVISDLKAELVKQTELARKNHNTNQHLTMERDKCSKLNGFKDTLIKDYENTIKELQNQIAKQLEIINEVHVKVRSAHTSTIHTGRACSSPTPSPFSNRSTNSLHDVSDISSVRNEDSLTREFITAKEDATIKTSEHLDLVSLLDGESSHTILDSHKNQVTNDGAAAQNNSNGASRNLSTNSANRRKSLFNSLEKDYNKENDVYKTRKVLRSEEIQNNTKKNLSHDASKVLEGIASDRIPVNVPSPVRDYPSPFWSDTSLPSISSTSNLDIVSSKND